MVEDVNDYDHDNGGVNVHVAVNDYVNVNVNVNVYDYVYVYVYGFRCLSISWFPRTIDISAALRYQGLLEKGGAPQARTSARVNGKPV